ncbi:MerR family transcriptional regulator [Terribacillus sp. 179-K 1B1 HS]|uniref:MerR family transcriptional regulator n=1 Tax=Terribacillus sp. 179-K 1B1 HS TaxID=3142388 RepID=UPI0039A2666D
MKKLFRTGDVAKLHDVTSDTVRFYDKEGLVNPTIKKQKYRYYDLNTTSLFSIVTLLREVNMPLQEIKKTLLNDELSHLTAHYEEHTKYLVEQKEQLERKISYLNEYNQKLNNFEHKPNTFEVIDNLNLYICEGQHFSLEGTMDFNDTSSNYVDDQLWNRTSLIVKMNFHVNKLTKKENKYYCGNIIDSECNEAKPLIMDNLLRFNFVGRIDDDDKYLEEIYKKAVIYCKSNNLSLSPHAPVYELFLLTQKIDNIDRHYISIFFQLINNK